MAIFYGRFGIVRATQLNKNIFEDSAPAPGGSSLGRSLCSRIKGAISDVPKAPWWMSCGASFSIALKSLLHQNVVQI